MVENNRNHFYYMHRDQRALNNGFHIMKLNVFSILSSILIISFAFLFNGCRVSETTVNVRIFESGAYSGITDENSAFMIIANQDKLYELLGSLHARRAPMPEPLPVEFETQMIAAAFMGEKPTAGYGIFFEEIGKIIDDTLNIVVIMTSPPEDRFTAQVVTSPYVLAAIERDEYSHIAFRDTGGNVLQTLDVPKP